MGNREAAPTMLSYEGSTRLGVIGDVRFEMDDAHVAFAQEALDGGIQFAHRVPRGWVFGAAWGDVYGSDTFLGTLRYLGRGGEEDWGRGTRARDGRGPFVVRQVGDRWLWTDGQAPLAPLQLPPGAPWREVMFGDGTFGCGRRADGSVMATLNAGRSWRRVDLRGDTLDPDYTSDMRALGLRDDGTFVVHLSHGPHALLPDGTLGPILVPTPRAPRPSAEFSPAEVTRVRFGLIERFPAMLSAPPAVTLASGASWARWGSTFVERSAAGSLREHPVPDWFVSCQLVGWGARVVAQCSGREGMVTTDGEAFAPFAFVREDTAISADGVHAARLGPCSGRPSQSSSTICALLDGATSTREFTAPVPLGAIVAGRGDTFVVLAEGLADPLIDRSGGHPSGLRGIYTFVASTGAFTELVVTPPTGERLSSLTLSSARFTPQGEVELITREGGGRRGAVGHALPDANVAMQWMPRDTQVAGFVDSLHGFAADRRSGHVWQTDDGGARWTELAMPIDGLTHFGYLNRSGDEPMRCNESGCAIGPQLFLRGYGPTRATPVIAAISRDPPEPSE